MMRPSTHQGLRSGPNFPKTRGKKVKFTKDLDEESQKRPQTRRELRRRLRREQEMIDDSLNSNNGLRIRNDSPYETSSRAYSPFCYEGSNKQISDIASKPSNTRPSKDLRKKRVTSSNFTGMSSHRVSTKSKASSKRTLVHKKKKKRRKS